MLFWLILVSVIEKSHICWSLILPVYLFMWPDFVRLRTFTQFLFASVYGAKWSSRVWYYQATIHVRHCLVLASLGKWACFERHSQISGQDPVLALKGVSVVLHLTVNIWRTSGHEAEWSILYSLKCWGERGHRLTPGIYNTSLFHCQHKYTLSKSAS